MAQSFQIDSSVTELGYAEPVSLVEAKLHARIVSDEFDTMIEDVYLPTARRMIEASTGLSLVPKEVSVIFDNCGGNFELPYGPITTAKEDLTFLNEDGAEVTATVIGYNYLTVKSPKSSFVEVTYNAGYSELPSELKTLILDQFAYIFENRGDEIEGKGLSPKVIHDSQLWTRTPAIF